MENLQKKNGIYRLPASVRIKPGKAYGRSIWSISCINRKRTPETALQKKSGRPENMTFSDHPEKLYHVDYRRMAGGVTRRNSGMSIAPSTTPLKPCTRLGTTAPAAAASP